MAAITPDQVIEQCNDLIDDNPMSEEVGTWILLRGLAEYIKENLS